MNSDRFRVLKTSLLVALLGTPTWATAQESVIDRLPKADSLGPIPFTDEMPKPRRIYKEYQKTHKNCSADYGTEFAPIPPDVTYCFYEIKMRKGERKLITDKLIVGNVKMEWELPGVSSSAAGACLKDREAKMAWQLIITLMPRDTPARACPTAPAPTPPVKTRRRAPAAQPGASNPPAEAAAAPRDLGVRISAKLCNKYGIGPALFFAKDRRTQETLWNGPIDQDACRQIQPYGGPSNIGQVVLQVGQGAWTGFTVTEGGEINQ